MKSKLGHARNFKDPEVYKLSRDLAKDFPKEEKYALTDQMRRSSGSIGAQIAESWEKRGFKQQSF